MTKVQTLTWAILTTIGGIAGVLIGEAVAKAVR